MNALTYILAIVGIYGFGYGSGKKAAMRNIGEVGTNILHILKGGR